LDGDRVEAGAGADDKFRFTNLAEDAGVRIYSVSGKLVEELPVKTSSDGSSSFWDVRDVAGGIYIYVVKSAQGVQKGKMSVIR